MKKAVDRKGGEWNVDINIFVAKRVKEELDIYLTVGDEKQLGELMTKLGDMFLFVEVLWICCDKQAVERGLDEPSFQQLWDVPSIGEALKVFLEELQVFFDNPALNLILDEVIQQAEAGVKEAKRILKEEGTAIREALRGGIEQRLKSPASSESSHVREHSAN